jgi:hypothetical protein
MNNFVTYPLPQMNKTLNETEKMNNFVTYPLTQMKKTLNGTEK